MGPLRDLKIIEFAGIGPTQFCGMLLADMGATILRIARSADDDGVTVPPRYNVMNRSRPTVVVDLKQKDGHALVASLCRDADAVFEGYRPGVMERLALGPDELLAANPRLVYGRMTGWGQHGPLADRAGHDANYAALSGALGAIGPADGPPVLPLNLVADFGGGGAYLAIGMLAALIEAGRSGEGQVVDAAMVDGAASLMALFYGLLAAGMWRDRRGSNLLDGAAPFYRCYETRDGGHVAVGALEPQFFRELLERLAIEDIDPAEQYDARRWPQHHEILARTFANKTRDEWSELLSGSDTCVAPVLSLEEATRHPHNRARETFVDVDGIRQPAPAPRFSRTPGTVQSPAGAAVDPVDVLEEWGIARESSAALRDSGVLGVL